MVIIERKLKKKRRVLCLPSHIRMTINVNLKKMLALILIDRASSTPKNIQSTYRPTEITQATPQHHRENYTPKPDLGYQQPTQIYNTEYDDVLVSQVRDGIFF